MAKLTLLQLQHIDTNRLVCGMFDDVFDKYLCLAFYLGDADTLPADKEIFGESCWLFHRAERNIYVNLGSDGAAPNWQLAAGGTVPTFPSLINKGDLLTSDGINAVILPVGPNGTILTADSTQPDGISWQSLTTIQPSVATSSQATTDHTPASSLTWSHVSSGTDRLLTVEVSTEQSRTITGITYNGVPLTQAVSKTNTPNNLRVETWYLVAPPVGTYSIIISMSGSSDISAFAQTSTQVNQSSPIGVTQVSGATSSSPNFSLVTSTNYSIIIDALATQSPGISYTAGSGQIINGQWTSPIAQGISSSKESGAAPDTVPMSYTMSASTPWVYCGVEIKGVAPTLSSLEIDDGSTVYPNITKIKITGGGKTMTNPALGEIDLDIPGGGSSFVINQVGHGFSVGNIIRPTTNQWTTSRSNTATNAEAWAQVTSVIDVDHFVAISLQGVRQMDATIVALISGFPGGTVIYVSSGTPGGLTDTPPTAAGMVSKPIGYVEANAGGVPIAFLTCNYRGQKNQSIPVGAGIYTINADETIIDWFTILIQPFLANFGWSTSTTTGTTAGSTQQGDGLDSWIGTTGATTATFAGSAIIRTATEARLRFALKQESTDGREHLQIGFTNNYINVPIGGGSVEAKSTSGGTTTTTLGAILPTDLHIYEIVFSAGGAVVKFYVDGVLLATHTTNIGANVNLVQFTEQLVYSGGSGGTTKFFISQLVLATQI